MSQSIYDERSGAWYASYLDRFESEQPPLLELGSGLGLLLDLAAERGIEATGIERDKERVEACLARGLDVRRQDLGEPWPFPDDSFGMIYSGQVIEHVPEPVKLNMFRESLRVLRPGGQFQICSPCRHYERARLDRGHYFLLTPSELHVLLREAEWQDIVSLDYPQDVPEIPKDVFADLWARYRPDLLSQSASCMCTKP